MNKELIKKYKAEFDHWLNGGRCLHLYHGVEWHETKESTWSKNPIHIIINDSYSFFRKALAEGKTVEFSGTEDGNNWAVSSEYTFGRAPEHYRIKPDEPKFKVGDWVTKDLAHSKPFVLTIGNIGACIRGYNLELWKPQPGEWCWFWNKGEVTYSLGMFKTHTDGAKLPYEDNNFDRWDYCEPFINRLPSKAEEKRCWK